MNLGAFYWSLYAILFLKGGILSSSGIAGQATGATTFLII